MYEFVNGLALKMSLFPRKSMHCQVTALFFGGLVLIGQAAQAATIVLNFEGFPDGTVLSNQYSGVAFTNAAVLKAGFSLNESEFPPRSGTNVATDIGGPISIAFTTPATSFSAYFTYLSRLTVTAFNAANTPIGSVTSAFTNNLACLAGPPCSGNPGSSPNELLSLTIGSGISKVTIKGANSGGSFVVDDATFSTPTAPVPEPAGIVLLVSGLLVLRLRATRS